MSSFFQSSAHRAVLAACLLWFVAPAPGQVLEQELPGPVESQVFFGRSLDAAPDGSWIVASGYGGAANGRAWVFRHDGAGYVLHAVLSGVATTSPDGNPVAISADGSVVAIGSPYVGSGNGVVHVYRRVVDIWLLDETFSNPGSGSQGAWFGSGIDLSDDGTVLVIGDWFSVQSLQVHRYDGATWNLDGTFDEATVDERLGIQISLDGSGTRFIAAAPGYDDSGPEVNSGAVRIFAYDGATWIQQALIVNPDPVSAELFGDHVAIDGDTAVIGARYDSEIDYQVGAAYACAWDGASWSIVQEILPVAPACDYQCLLGASADVQGDRMLVSAPGVVLQDSVYSASAAYLYRRGDSGAGEPPWVFVTRVFREQPPVGGGAARGPVALIGDRVIIASEGEVKVGVNAAGAVRVYRLEDCLCGGLAEIFDDPLDATWLPFGCGTVDTDGGELSLSAGAGCDRVGVQIDRREVMLCGDFDLTVDWRYESWPTPIAYASFRAAYAAVNRVNNDDDRNTLAAIARVDAWPTEGACFAAAGNPSQYMAWTGTMASHSNPPWGLDPCQTSLATTPAPTSATSGSFRIRRTGATVTCSYDEGGGWVDLLSEAIDDTAVSVEFFAQSSLYPPLNNVPDPAPFEVRFSNLLIDDTPATVCFDADPQPGACCFPDTACIEIVGAVACAGLGGVFEAGGTCAGVACPLVPGPCCLADDFQEDTDLDAYTIIGPGVAAIIDDPYTPGNRVLRLENEVSVTRVVDTLLAPLEIGWRSDIPIPNSPQELEVSLAGTVIGTFTEAQIGSGALTAQSISVTDPSLLGLAAVDLRFAWVPVGGGVAGGGIPTLLIDDIHFSVLPVPPCPGDTDGDGFVDVNDLNNVILDWGTDGSAHDGDLTGQLPGSPPDGAVDVNDLNAVIVGWGPCD